MCEANACLRRGKVEELILHNIDRVEPASDGLLLESTFRAAQDPERRIREPAPVEHKNHPGAGLVRY
jgi:hypothetical protein